MKARPAPYWDGKDSVYPDAPGRSVLALRSGVEKLLWNSEYIPDDVDLSGAQLVYKVCPLNGFVFFHLIHLLTSATMSIFLWYSEIFPGGLFFNVNFQAWWYPFILEKPICRYGNSSMCEVYNPNEVCKVK